MKPQRTGCAQFPSTPLPSLTPSVVSIWFSFFVVGQTKNNFLGQVKTYKKLHHYSKVQVIHKVSWSNQTVEPRNTVEHWEGRWRKSERERRGKMIVGQSLLTLCNLVDYDQFPRYRWPSWPWATLPPSLCMVRALCTVTWRTLQHISNQPLPPPPPPAAPRSRPWEISTAGLPHSGRRAINKHWRKKKQHKCFHFLFSGWMKIWVSAVLLFFFLFHRLPFQSDRCKKLWVVLLQQERRKEIFLSFFSPPPSLWQGCRGIEH